MDVAFEVDNINNKDKMPESHLHENQNNLAKGKEEAKEY